MRQIIKITNPLTVAGAAVWLLIMGTFLLGAGFGYTHSGDNLFNFHQLVSDLYANAGMELLSIAITVLIIDRLNHHHNFEERKYSLFRRMRSSSRDVAIAALEEIQHQGFWEEALKHHYEIHTSRIYFSGIQWSDANLNNVDINRAWLDGANLQNARLGDSNLQDVVARGATMQGASLSNANIQNAVLEGTNLQSASLDWANLTSANLTNANLQGASLYNTKFHSANLQGVCLRGAVNLHLPSFAPLFNERTVLPDAKRIDDFSSNETRYDKYWTPGTDMTRYTNPEHPDFWEPEWAKRRQENK
jgi:uncharacterized protein YjbI with pentapeptide repeats